MQHAVRPFRHYRRLRLAGVSKNNEAPEFRPLCAEFAIGGAGGIRTPYLNTASVALSRLSYSPEDNVPDGISGLGVRQTHHGESPPRFLPATTP